MDESDSGGRTALHYMADNGASSALMSTLVEGLDGMDIRQLTNPQDQRGCCPTLSRSSAIIHEAEVGVTLLAHTQLARSKEYVSRNL